MIRRAVPAGARLGPGVWLIKRGRLAAGPCGAVETVYPAGRLLVAGELTGAGERELRALDPDTEVCGATHEGFARWRAWAAMWIAS